MCFCVHLSLSLTYLLHDCVCIYYMTVLHDCVCIYCMAACTFIAWLRAHLLRRVCKSTWLNYETHLVHITSFQRVTGYASQTWRECV